MAEPLDAHTLAGFAQALQGLLPTIQEGIAACLRDPSQPEVLEDAYEAVQAISDAALMLGLVELDELASAISGVLENLAAEHSPHTIAEAAWAREAVAQLAPYLASVPAMDEAAHPIIPTLLQALRQLPTDPAPETAAPITPMPQNTAEPMADVAAMELHASFLAEAEDHLHTLGQALPAWGAQPEQPELLQTIRRCVHTLKGAAAIVGQHAVAQLTHRMEDLLEALAHGQCALNPTVYDLLLATVDVLDHFLRDQRAQGDLGPQATAGLYQRYAVLLGEVPTSPSRTPTPVSPVLPTAGLRRAAEMVRIPIERLDELVRLVSELVISRSVYEQHLGRLSRHVDELRLSMDRLRRVTATVETQLESSLRPETVAFLEGAPALARPHQDFDVLEFERYGAAQLVSRELSETTADIGALEQELGDIFGDLDGYLTRHGRLTSEMQDK
ncbi:MAG: hypothetical protein FJZ47_23025, partial [Candidatus Tectomicrobia bacterium]|nr:hypothetical protein [Candidatus Tectomicrobia bacterium]